jgi:hypothetical protein
MSPHFTSLILLLPGLVIRLSHFDIAAIKYLVFITCNGENGVF